VPAPTLLSGGSQHRNKNEPAAPIVIWHDGWPADALRNGFRRTLGCGMKIELKDQHGRCID